VIQIRLHTAADAAQLVPLFRCFFALHRQLLGNPQPLGDAEAAETAEKPLNQPASWTVVAEDDESGEILGFARWEEREGAFFGRELFVRPEHRKRGIGTRLWQEVERRVVEAGGDALFVSIVPHNKDVLTVAQRCGYDTLNTVELRKELLGERPRRGQLKMLGLEWKTL
jgi:GNAT superfamily N-acetyltransferase